MAMLSTHRAPAPLASLSSVSENRIPGICRQAVLKREETRLPAQGTWEAAHPSVCNSPPWGALVSGFSHGKIEAQKGGDVLSLDLQVESGGVGI